MADPRMVVMTGASGYLGSHAHSVLRAEGFGVHRLGRRDADSIVDLVREEPPWEEVHDRAPSVLVHAAGIMSVDAESVLHSAAMARNVLLNLPASVERLVLVSSAYVYAPAEATRTEDDAPKPVDVYGHTKLMVESLFGAFALATSRSLVVLRPCAIYGPNDPHKKAISRFVECALRGEPPTLKGAISFARDYVHVDDAARAVVSAVALPRASEGGEIRTFNVCTGGAWSAVELARMIGELVPAARVRNIADLPKADAIGYRFDPSRATRELGFTAETHLTEALVALLSLSSAAEEPS